MALADYRLCDLCDCKAFYDSNLNYEWKTFEEQKVGGLPYSLDMLGDWAVLCNNCAKTHKTIIVSLNEVKE